MFFLKVQWQNSLLQVELKIVEPLFRLFVNGIAAWLAQLRCEVTCRIRMACAEHGGDAVFASPRSSRFYVLQRSMVAGRWASDAARRTTLTVMSYSMFVP